MVHFSFFLIVPRNGKKKLKNLTNPPPIKCTVIEMCSRSSGLYSFPQLPRCSRKMLVHPYVKISALSANSAEGRHLRPGTRGRTFHACHCPLALVACSLPRHKNARIGDNGPILARRSSLPTGLGSGCRARRRCPP